MPTLLFQRRISGLHRGNKVHDSIVVWEWQWMVWAKPHACSLEKGVGKDKENKYLINILFSGCLYRNLLKYKCILSKCYCAFGHGDFCRIMCNCFACNIKMSGFLEKQYNIRQDLVPDDFWRMMCNSFFYCFKVPSFFEKVYDLQQGLDPLAFFNSCMVVFLLIVGNLALLKQCRKLDMNLKEKKRS